MVAVLEIKAIPQQSANTKVGDGALSADSRIAV